MGQHTDSHTKGTALVVKAGAKRRKGGRARAVIDRPPPRVGWRSTDDEEIELRRWRGRTEITGIEALESKQPFFGTFRVLSGSGSFYDVEIRDLEGFGNSCGCIDHRANGLGTCKHVEGVVAALQERGVRKFREAAEQGSERVEVFLDRRDTPKPALMWPEGRRRHTDPVMVWLESFLESDGTLTSDPARIEALISAWHFAPLAIRNRVRVSRHFAPWLDRLRRERSRQEARAAFLAEVKDGSATFDMLRFPLLPYQCEGMLHLAFGERTLLADEMGLGKTIQAIAACELLARRRDIKRVLVVCPASLKAEWEEQIARFTDRPTRAVFGSRAARLLAYREPKFFTIVNYEQVLGDAADINKVLAPDVIVLDEAQRIKNWHIKTARQVKQLRSPYAFVLTGTPVENRIDELYSIVQYLDPELVGPLFRFNRDFYELDERGRPIEYRNLGELRRRLQHVMLRRRKADVESELPGRTVKTYFVQMAEEQRLRYEDYRLKAARIASIAKRRPLTPDEFKQLQLLLACMRMICDTPAILDPTCRICPKLEELEGILSDLLEDPDRKIIVFSEWERMLELVRELAGELGVEVAWHTGSVPQKRRRAEITRFKQDPACRLFLSTDSGSVGLNLQAASAVINVDMPWNPAKLEQRIARAWRKNQTRSVTVVNLVTELSIEHQILHIIGRKQALSDGVLDGYGDIGSLKMPSGRGALIERMQAMLQVPPAAAPPIRLPEDVLAEEIVRRHRERAWLIEARSGNDGRIRVLVVLDIEAQGIAAEAKRHEASREGGPTVEVIDKSMWETMQRLAASGMVSLGEGQSRVLHQSPEMTGAADSSADPNTEQRVRAAELRVEADKSLRMARVLVGGGFSEEALPLMAKAIGIAAAAHLASLGELGPGV